LGSSVINTQNQVEKGLGNSGALLPAFTKAEKIRTAISAAVIVALLGLAFISLQQTSNSLRQFHS
jgi:hypothetical protein